MNKTTEYIKTLLPEELRVYLDRLSDEDEMTMTEIRLRAARPMQLSFLGKTVFSDKRKRVTEEDINDVILRMTDHSLNSVHSEIVSGFIPLKYGCRAGIAGDVVIKNGNIDFIRNITSINIRIAHEMIGIATPLVPYLRENGMLNSTLVISPPKCGKTTLIRDIARMLSVDNDVVIIDERKEIASVFSGKTDFDTGIRTDVFSNCAKPDGIRMAVRSLAPDVIVTDEIATEKDAEALIDAAKCGIAFVATAHGGTIEEVLQRPMLKELFKCNAVDIAVLLSSSPVIGAIKEIRRLT